MGALERLQQPALTQGIAADVLEGLRRTPKALPPRLFYDEEGSRLFEQITTLPEYYLTRTEHEILDHYAPEMLECAGTNLTVIELGAGTAVKTRVLLNALLRRQLRVDFYPVDVCSSALEAARERLAGELPLVKVHCIVADYTEGVAALNQIGGRKLLLYLGSSIGNFEPEDAIALLRNARAGLRERDCLLLGTDLVKEAAALLAAYNDSAGVTARFNLNLLARINRELGGLFDLRSFRHVALWNCAQSRMEMHLESRRRQTIRIAGVDLSVDFERGERIHTENSYKYTMPMIDHIMDRSGFRREFTWTDSRNWFGVHLARAA